jgi:hypothetical protein
MTGYEVALGIAIYALIAGMVFAALGWLMDKNGRR